MQNTLDRHTAVLPVIRPQPMSSSFNQFADLYSSFLLGFIGNHPFSTLFR